MRPANLSKRIKLLVKSLRVYKPEKIILFGSAARKNVGEYDEYSDLDAVVIKKTSKRFLRRAIEVGKLLDDEVFPADVFVYTPEEFERMKEEGNPFIEQVLKSGRTIYEKR